MPTLVEMFVAEFGDPAKLDTRRRLSSTQLRRVAAYGKAAEQLIDKQKGGQTMPKLQDSAVQPNDVFGPVRRAMSAHGPNVKRPSEMYATKRIEATHKKFGTPILREGKAVELPSERDFGTVRRVRSRSLASLWRAEYSASQSA